MKPWLLAGGLCLVALSGCTRLAVVAANVPAAFGDYEVRKDISYGPGARQQLDVYMPRGQAAQARPVLVFFYGGGWTAGAKEDYRFVAEAFTSRGFIAVVADYRLAPQVAFPVFVQDAALAVRWVRENAAGFGGDPRALHLVGHSAGAHIAALIAFDERYLEQVGGSREWIRGFIGLAGPYDFLPLTDPKVEAVFAAAPSLAATQPVNFVDGGEPRSLLLHGEADLRVWPRNSRQLAARIRDRGGDVEEHYYAGMSHGGILGALSVYLRQRESVLDRIAAFVDPARAERPGN